MLPAEVVKTAEELLEKQAGSTVAIQQVISVGGGSINETFQLDTTIGSCFLKFNSACLYPDMFELEARGLHLLHEADEIIIPKVITSGEAGEYAFLIMEYIDSGLQQKTFWQDFGISLAKLHLHTAPYFGLAHNNYIGSLEQSNTMRNNWIEFFISERLEPQIRMANLPPDISAMFSKLFSMLEELVPVESPSLLHGDLWSGNYMTSDQGKAVIMDPAVYYGHREMDIGMTKLFGGFSESFYAAYNSEYPLETGWENRVDICNLYPLMVHVNLFGGSYLNQVTSILKKYT